MLLLLKKALKCGIIPGFVFKKENWCSFKVRNFNLWRRPGCKSGMGISTAIGIGGDPIIGTTTKDAIELFMNDPETDGIIMIGEIGGQLEADVDGLKKTNKTCCWIYCRSNRPLVEQWVMQVL